MRQQGPGDSRQVGRTDGAGDEVGVGEDSAQGPVLQGDGLRNRDALGRLRPAGDVDAIAAGRTQALNQRHGGIDEGQGIATAVQEVAEESPADASGSQDHGARHSDSLKAA